MLLLIYLCILCTLRYEFSDDAREKEVWKNSPPILFFVQFIKKKLQALCYKIVHVCYMKLSLTWAAFNRERTRFFGGKIKVQLHRAINTEERERERHKPSARKWKESARGEFMYVWGKARFGNNSCLIICNCHSESNLFKAVSRAQTKLIVKWISPYTIPRYEAFIKCFQLCSGKFVDKSAFVNAIVHETREAQKSLTWKIHFFALLARRSQVPEEEAQCIPVFERNGGKLQLLWSIMSCNRLTYIHHCSADWFSRRVFYLKLKVREMIDKWIRSWS
jgi:hypothetical protein